MDPDPPLLSTPPCQVPDGSLSLGYEHPEPRCWLVGGSGRSYCHRDFRLEEEEEEEFDLVVAVAVAVAW